MVGPAAHELPDLLVQQKRHTALQIPGEEMAQRHRHIRRMADHHHRPPAALGGHHRLASRIRAGEGIVHLVVAQAFGIQRPLMAHPAPHLIQLTPAQITAVDPELVIEPVAAAHDRARGQIPVEPQLTFLLLSCFCGIGAIEPS